MKLLSSEKRLMVYLAVLTQGTCDRQTHIQT